jgi:hypothetical protein
MGNGRRALVIFLVLGGSLGAGPASAEAAQNCTLTRDGEVYCDGGAQPVRVRVTGKVVQLAASGDSTCALTEPGAVYCWAPADNSAAGNGANNAAGNAANNAAGNAANNAASNGANNAAGDAAGKAATADQQAAALLSEDDDDLGFNPLILISVGLALVGAGFTLVKVGQGARPRAASRHRSAPSLSRSA